MVHTILHCAALYVQGAGTERSCKNRYVCLLRLRPNTTVCAIERWSLMPRELRMGSGQAAVAALLNRHALRCGMPDGLSTSQQ